MELRNGEVVVRGTIPEVVVDGGGVVLLGRHGVLMRDKMEMFVWRVPCTTQWDAQDAEQP